MIDAHEEFGIRWTNPKTGQVMTSGAWMRRVEADGFGRNNIAAEAPQGWGVPYIIVVREVEKWRETE